MVNKVQIPHYPLALFKVDLESSFILAFQDQNPLSRILSFNAFDETLQLLYQTFFFKMFCF